MTKAAADRMTLFVAVFGVVVTILSYALAGRASAYSTFTGAAIALANFILLRSIVLRVVSGDMHRKGPFIALIFVKMGGMMAIVFTVIAKHWVEPIAFTIGLSSLVVGLITCTLLALPDTGGPSNSPQLSNKSES